MIKVILWDIDATLLDFLSAEKNAIRSCFAHFHLGECTDGMLAHYSVLNKHYWEMLERKEISKERLLTERFEKFFKEEGIAFEQAAEFNALYQIALGDTICFYDQGYELVRALKGCFRQYAVTNGTFIAQERKLKRSGLGELMDGAFISDQIGHEKPTPEFFNHVLDQIGNYQKDEILIVGDSLTSDMQGGSNAGILCCWYNPNHLPNTTGVRTDYEIDHLWKLLTILKNPG